MTALTITPDAAKKRLKTAGKVASGEKVAVTIPGFGAVSTDNLRLRVMFGGITVGMFPLEDTDEWGHDGENLTCTLNLATEQAEKLCKFGVDVCVVLEDTLVPQLYGAGNLELLPWIKLAGVDVPVNLDNYKARIGEIETTLSKVHSVLNSHIANRENPHAVTKAQVGLGSVENTSDMAKPVSTAQQAALDAVRSAASTAVLAEQNRAIQIEAENRQMIYQLQNGIAAKLPKSAFIELSGETLSNDATQKDTKLMVQKILEVLKKAALCIMLAFAVPALAIDADTAWEEVPPQLPVKNVVEQFSPPADFSTNNQKLVETIQEIVTNVVFDTLSFASTNDIAELKDTLKNGIVNRASSIGTANAWIDATGAVWEVQWDVTKDRWTIEPQPNDMQVFWDGDSWVLRYEGYNNDTKRGADVYKFSFTLGQTYTATRHPGGATNCVGKLAMVQDIDAVKDTLATNLIKTVINNGTYNLTYDPVLKVTWRKEAENGVFYEKCYTNINMIGVSK